MHTQTDNPAHLCSTDSIHRQGSLDGLCGVYCVINGISLQLGDEVNCAELFSVVIKNIGRRLHTIILNGMLAPTLQKQVLEPCKEYLSKKGFDLTYSIADAKTLGNYWTLMKNHYEANGPGSILLSISGSIEHWSCIRRITPKRIVLADSGHLGYLQRARVTVKMPTKKRNHTLVPKETFLLTIKPVPVKDDA